MIAGAVRLIRSVSRETLLLPVHAWRLCSRFLPPRCKYHPSCSQYALDAVRGHGVIIGSCLAGWRVLRCNPWSLGGIDPVPSDWRTVVRCRSHKNSCTGGH